jgi:hypothetical protein
MDNDAFNPWVLGGAMPPLLPEAFLLAAALFLAVARMAG